MITDEPTRRPSDGPPPPPTQRSTSTAERPVPRVRATVWVAALGHEGAIGALLEADVVTGFADGTFRPGDPVQRGQSASMVARALPLLDLED